jgi:hypothetical protein
VRIRNTLKLSQMWVSDTLLEEARDDERLRVLEDPRPMNFDTDGSLL